MWRCKCCHGQDSWREIRPFLTFNVNTWLPISTCRIRLSERVNVSLQAMDVHCTIGLLPSHKKHQQSLNVSLDSQRTPDNRIPSALISWSSAPFREKEGSLSAVSICSKDFFQVGSWTPSPGFLTTRLLWDQISHILEGFQLKSMVFCTPANIRLVPEWSVSYRSECRVSVETHFSSFHILE